MTWPIINKTIGRSSKKGNNTFPDLFIDESSSYLGDQHIAEGFNNILSARSLWTEIESRNYVYGCMGM